MLVFQEDSPDSTVKPCPYCFWFKFQLTYVPRHKQLTWWHVDKLPTYSSVEYMVTTTKECCKGELDGVGKVYKSSIPEGTNEIEFPAIYTDIDDWIEKQLT